MLKHVARDAGVEGGVLAGRHGIMDGSVGPDKINRLDSVMCDVVAVVFLFQLRLGCVIEHKALPARRLRRDGIVRRPDFENSRGSFNAKEKFFETVHCMSVLAPLAYSPIACEGSTLPAKALNTTSAVLKPARR